MPGTTLDMAWVDAHLAIGGAFRSIQVGELSELGVKRVVDLRAESVDDAAALGRHGIDLLHLPTPDCCAIEDGCIERGIAWMSEPKRSVASVLMIDRLAHGAPGRCTSEALDRGHRVLVHCQYGIGRSAY